MQQNIYKDMALIKTFNVIIGRKVNLGFLIWLKTHRAKKGLIYRFQMPVAAKLVKSKAQNQSEKKNIFAWLSCIPHFDYLPRKSEAFTYKCNKEEHLHFLHDCPRKEITMYTYNSSYLITSPCKNVSRYKKFH
jgi:hypothetical protein